MKIGICTGHDNITAAIEAGYDYIELGLSSVAGLDEAEFKKLERFFAGSEIKCEALNLMLPGDLTLHGEGYDEKKVRGYITGAYRRAAALGAAVIVFGSGGARRYGGKATRGEAWDNLIKFARIAGDEAAKNGITLAMEPLNGGECDILNSVSEGYRFVVEVSHPNVMLLADSYHMWLENEAMDSIIEAGAVLRHTHISKKDRTYPLCEDEYGYMEFIDALKLAGYAGRMSVEAGTRDFASDAKKAYAMLKGLSARRGI